MTSYRLFPDASSSRAHIGLSPEPKATVWYAINSDMEGIGADIDDRKVYFAGGSDTDMALALSSAAPNADVDPVLTRPNRDPVTRVGYVAAYDKASGRTRWLLSADSAGGACFLGVKAASPSCVYAAGYSHGTATIKDGAGRVRTVGATGADPAVAFVLKLRASDGGIIWLAQAKGIDVLGDDGYPGGAVAFASDGRDCWIAVVSPVPSGFDAPSVVDFYDSTGRRVWSRRGSGAPVRDLLIARYDEFGALTATAQVLGSAATKTMIKRGGLVVSDSRVFLAATVSGAVTFAPSTSSTPSRAVAAPQPGTTHQLAILAVSKDLDALLSAATLGVPTAPPNSDYVDVAACGNNRVYVVAVPGPYTLQNTPLPSHGRRPTYNLVCQGAASWTATIVDLAVTNMCVDSGDRIILHGVYRSLDGAGTTQNVFVTDGLGRISTLDAGDDDMLQLCFGGVSGRFLWGKRHHTNNGATWSCSVSDGAGTLFSMLEVGPSDSSIYYHQLSLQGPPTRFPPSGAWRTTVSRGQTPICYELAPPAHDAHQPHQQQLVQVSNLTRPSDLAAVSADDDGSVSVDGRVVGALRTATWADLGDGHWTALDPPAVTTTVVPYPPDAILLTTFVANVGVLSGNPYGNGAYSAGTDGSSGSDPCNVLTPGRFFLSGDARHLRIALPYAIRLDQYTVSAPSDPDFDDGTQVKTWDLSGSNDGYTWTLLHSAPFDYEAWTAGAVRTFPNNTPNNDFTSFLTVDAHALYRFFEFTFNNVGGRGIRVGQIRLFSATVTP